MRKNERLVLGRFVPENPLEERLGQLRLVFIMELLDLPKLLVDVGIEDEQREAS